MLKWNGEGIIIADFHCTSYWCFLSVTVHVVHMALLVFVNNAFILLCMLLLSPTFDAFLHSKYLGTTSNENPRTCINIFAQLSALILNYRRYNISYRS